MGFPTPAPTMTLLEYVLNYCPRVPEGAAPAGEPLPADVTAALLLARGRLVPAPEAK